MIAILVVFNNYIIMSNATVLALQCGLATPVLRPL
jgi:hypothetical protein